jgi:hypothetical protein
MLKMVKKGRAAAFLLVLLLSISSLIISSEAFASAVSPYQVEQVMAKKKVKKKVKKKRKAKKKAAKKVKKIKKKVVKKKKKTKKKSSENLTTPRGKPTGVPMMAFYQHPCTTRALG